MKYNFTRTITFDPIVYKQAPLEVFLAAVRVLRSIDLNMTLPQARSILAAGKYEGPTNQADDLEYGLRKYTTVHNETQGFDFCLPPGMVNPLRNRRDYMAIGRPVFLVDVIPQTDPE